MLTLGQKKITCAEGQELEEGSAPGADHKESSVGNKHIGSAMVDFWLKMGGGG